MSGYQIYHVFFRMSLTIVDSLQMAFFVAYLTLGLHEHSGNN